MSKEKMPVAAGKKISTLSNITKNGMEIKIEREIPDVYLLSGKRFKVVGIQKELFNGDLDCVEVVTNFSPDCVRAIFHAFGFPVYDIEYNEKQNTVVVIGG